MEIPSLTSPESPLNVSLVYVETGQTGNTDKASFDPVSAEALTLFRQVITGFWLIIALTGIATNVMNICVFLKIGLEDSVTISFFALSLSDFVVSLITLAEILAGLCDVLEKKWDLWFSLPPFIPTVYLACVRKIFTSTTALITTYLAVQRCFCLLLPFRVKSIFNNFKTYCFLTVTFITFVVCFGLYIWRHQVIKIPVTGSNSSRLRLYILPGSEPYFFLRETILAVVLNMGCQIIIVLCLVVIYVMLKKSVQFRGGSATKDKKNAHCSTVAGADALDEKKNSKESQALKQVIIISTIFVVTNCPILGFGVANSFIPEFGLHEAYHNLYHLVVIIMFTAETSNSAVNFFVYYNYHTKFRSQCKLFMWT